MTGKLKNVYVESTSIVAGPIEKRGPLAKYFDKVYTDYRLDKSFELSEVKMIIDSYKILLNKSDLSKKNIDLTIGGDLLNQICATSYGIEKFNTPFLGVFSACATSIESIIIASKFLENQNNKKAICIVSSHNLTSERQFRNPIEYGYTKPKTSTFTSTGAASILLSNKKTDVKITNYTIGKIVNYNLNDPNNMGAVMAPAAADTIYKHFTDLNLKEDYYDLILTGDLGIYGKEILKDYMKEKYNFNLKNYNDCGVMLYDLNKQKEVMAGGSGPVCSALVNYGYIYNQLKTKKLKRVLLIATGALFSPTFLYQKQNIYSIAHAISMEAI